MWSSRLSVKLAKIQKTGDTVTSHLVGSGVHVTFMFISPNTDLESYQSQFSKQESSGHLCVVPVSRQAVLSPLALLDTFQCSLQSHFQAQLGSPSLHSRNGMEQKDSSTLLLQPDKVSEEHNMIIMFKPSRE